MENENTFANQVVQGVIIALIVAGILWYLKTKSNTVTGFPGLREPTTMSPTRQSQYSPVLGFHVLRGTPVDNAECNVSFVGENPAIPIATDYLDCSPSYTPSVSAVNLGRSVTPCCGGVVKRKETGTAFPLSIECGTCTVPDPIAVTNDLSCDPQVNAFVPSQERI